MRDGLEEDTLQRVERWRDLDEFSDAEKIALEYTELFAYDHHSIDDEFWARLQSHFADDEIVDLTVCIGKYLAFGRIHEILEFAPSWKAGDAEHAPQPPA